jgi:hypothetical protein
VNGQLERGCPFSVDIAGQGIELYEAEGFAFAQPPLLPPNEARAEAQKHLETWFPSARAFLRMARSAIDDGDNNASAFVLHQSAERLYQCTLLTLTLYSSKSHKLNLLRSQAEGIARGLVRAWPPG